MIILLRNILGVLLLILALFLSIPFSLASFLFPRPWPLAWLVKVALKVLRFALGMSLETKNRPWKRLEEEPGVVVGNHTSLLDPPLLFSVLPGITRFFYKADLMKVPIVHLGLKAAGFIPVDRKNPRKTAQALEKILATGNVRDNVGIFPEGTRSKDGYLGQFKKGAFVLAKEKGVPIYPVYLIGFRESMPKGSYLMRPSRLIVEFLEPLDKETVAALGVEELRERVHSLLKSREEKSEPNR